MPLCAWMVIAWPGKEAGYPAAEMARRTDQARRAGGTPRHYGPESSYIPRRRRVKIRLPLTAPYSVAEYGDLSGFFRISQTDVRCLNVLNARLAS